MTFVCEECGQERSGVRRRCYPCTVGRSPGNQYTRGAKFAPETMAKAVATRTARGFVPFDIAAVTRGKPAINACPVNTQRLVKDGRWQIKTEEGQFRWPYLSRVMWEHATGESLTSRDIIHHVNGNPADDRIGNFEKLTRATHLRAHTQLVAAV